MPWAPRPSALLFAALFGGLAAVGCLAPANDPPNLDGASPGPIDAPLEGVDARADDPPASYRGRLLVEERFPDADTAARGWYDQPGNNVDLTTTAPGSPGGAYRCQFTAGANPCDGSILGRHTFDAVESVYASYRIKHTAGWIPTATNNPIQLLSFISDADEIYVGPSYTVLTVSVNEINTRGHLTVDASRNVDTSCVRESNGNVIGCGGGSFEDHVFTEARSVASCNGVLGLLDGQQCNDNGDGTYHSARFWSGATMFSTAPGSDYFGDWQQVEAYIRLNTISGGVGLADGQLRLWQNGRLIFSSNQILFRTGANPNLKLNQLGVFPFVGFGSENTQGLWVDDLVVAEGAR